MAWLPLKCGRCRKQFRVPLGWTGQLVICPSCNLKFRAIRQEEPTVGVKKCLRCGQPLDPETEECRSCSKPDEPDPIGTPTSPEQHPTSVSDRETAFFWQRLFHIEGGFLPEVMLLILGWSCTVVELVLQFLGVATVTWGSPGVTAILVMVVLMIVIWTGSAIRKVIHAEFGNADFGSLTLVIASSTALFWAHHVQYPAAEQAISPTLVLIGSIVLQVVATAIMLWPLLRQK
jgi:hypothetical protein